MGRRAVWQYIIGYRNNLLILVSRINMKTAAQQLPTKVATF